MRLPDWLLCALSDDVMLPLFGSLRGTVDTTPVGRLSVLVCRRAEERPAAGPNGQVEFS